MDLMEMRSDARDWIDLAQDREQWRAYVSAVINLRVPLKPIRNCKKLSFRTLLSRI